MKDANSYVLDPNLILKSLGIGSDINYLSGHLIGKDDPISLANDEKLLFEYALSLNVWLIDARKYVNAYYKGHKFPLFEDFDPQFKGRVGEEGLKARIAYYKHYIGAIKPIATSIYYKYTQVTLKE